MTNYELLHRNEVIADIERYKEEKKQLLEDIDKIEQKDELLREQKIVGERINLLYWRMPVSELNTVFFTRKAILKKDHRVCMLEESESMANPPLSPLARPKFRMAVLCEDAFETENGVVLAVRDPYKRACTTPMDIDINTAKGLVGKILSLSFIYNEKKELAVRRWKATDLTQHGYKGSHDEIANRIAKVVYEFAYVRTEEKAEEAVTMLLNYFRTKETYIKAIRLSPTHMRMLIKEHENEAATLYGIKFEDEKLWYMEEPGHEYEQISDTLSDFYDMILTNTTGKGYDRDKHDNERWAFKCIKEAPPEMENII